MRRFITSVVLRRLLKYTKWLWNKRKVISNVFFHICSILKVDLLVFSEGPVHSSDPVWFVRFFYLPLLNRTPPLSWNKGQSIRAREKPLLQYCKEELFLPICHYFHTTHPTHSYQQQQLAKVFIFEVQSWNKVNFFHKLLLRLPQNY